MAILTAIMYFVC